MSKVGYSPSQDTDGIFWMNVQDFLQNFKYLYICRVMGESWTAAEFRDAWEGPSAGGFGPKAKFRNNPQYAITIHRPC